jgi:UPF0755 protein
MILVNLTSNSPVKLAFNNQERIENLQVVGSQIEADSLVLPNTFKDSVFLLKWIQRDENILAMFISILMKYIEYHSRKVSR